MIFVYGRVSAKDQKLERQEDAFASINYDEAFYDKASGKDLERAEFKRMVAKLRRGDLVIVKSIDRLSRSMRDFAVLWEEWRLMGVNLRIMDLGLELSATDENGMTKFIVNVMVAAGELERGMIRQRQREGLAAAYARGVGKRGASAKTLEAREKIASMKEKGYTDEDAIKLLGVSRATFYKLKKEVMTK